MKISNVWSGVATAVLLGGIGNVANAQDSTDQSSNLATVVITGVRASVQSALDAKKNSDQLLESIVAQDIGKLPDNNVIEALQHVTGIPDQPQRRRGEPTAFVDI
jgi:iron complex outermembrane recepter protein